MPLPTEPMEGARRDTIALFERTGSPIITDGEQIKPSFATYPLSGLGNLAPDGLTIPFAVGRDYKKPLEAIAAKQSNSKS